MRQQREVLDKACDGWCLCLYTHARLDKAASAAYSGFLPLFSPRLPTVSTKATLITDERRACRRVLLWSKLLVPLHISCESFDNRTRRVQSMAFQPEVQWGLVETFWLRAAIWHFMMDSTRRWSWGKRLNKPCSHIIIIFARINLGTRSWIPPEMWFQKNTSWIYATIKV